MNHASLDSIAAALATLDVIAYVEYPGYLAIPTAGETWNFGTANPPTWTGDRQTFDGHCTGTADTGIPLTEPDPLVIAKAIVEAIWPNP